jgi:hypothetical protein
MLPTVPQVQRVIKVTREQWALLGFKVQQACQAWLAFLVW